jgi:restriction system protein
MQKSVSIPTVSLFVGRDRELRWLDQHLSRRGSYHQQVPLFIVGAPGSGKTMLLKQWEFTRRERFDAPWEKFGIRWLPSNSVLLTNDVLTQYTEDLYAELTAEGHVHQDIVVVIDNSDLLLDHEIEQATGKLLNLKRIKSVVFLTRRMPSIKRRHEVLNIAGLDDNDAARLLLLISQGKFPANEIEEVLKKSFGFPMAISMIANARQLNRDQDLSTLLESPIYDLSKTILLPESKLISIVTPCIVTTTENLLHQLKRQPDSIHELSPRKFEELIAELLNGMGHRVELTPATRDGGKDILAYIDTDFGEMLCLVEAKKYRASRPVGVELVRSLYGTLCDFQANSAMLVTTSRFTADAQNFQSKHKYQLNLKDYSNIVEWIQNHKS